MKKKILSACKEMQLASIQSLELTVKEAQTAANEYGLPRDRYDSFRSQLLRKKDMFGQQLAKAKEQLDILAQINPEKSCAHVEFGALIITDKQHLFISIGLGKVVQDDVVYFAISPAVPIYKAMEGKKVGEEFTFNNITYKIEEIY